MLLLLLEDEIRRREESTFQWVSLSHYTINLIKLYIYISGAASFNEILILHRAAMRLIRKNGAKKKKLVFSIQKFK